MPFGIDTMDSDALQPYLQVFVAILTMKDSYQEWSDKWQHRDERLNFAQRHDVELVRQSVRPDVELRVRAEVNELIGRELQNLQAKIARRLFGLNINPFLEWGKRLRNWLRMARSISSWKISIVWLPGSIPDRCHSRPKG